MTSTPAPAPSAVKAEKPVLPAQTTVESALSILGQSCLTHVQCNQAAALDGRDPEGVHQMRVGLRRLRSVRAIFAKAIPDADRQWIKAESKWLFGELGLARDLDVFLAEILAPAGGVIAASDSARLKAAALDLRQEGYLRLRAAVATPRHSRFALRLQHWLTAQGWQHGASAKARAWQHRPAQELAQRILKSREKRVGKTPGVLATLSADERHRLRIALKLLRYAAEFFRSLYPQRSAVRTYLGTLRLLQDVLGTLNDQVVAKTLIERLAAMQTDQAAADTVRRAGERVIAWHEARNVRREHELDDAWQAFCALTPFWHFSATTETAR